MSSLPARPPERSANIFINYRREDSAGHAGRLFDGLSDHFPGRLFMDVDTIAPGIDFGEAIEQAVGACEVLIVVIGRDWLTVKNAAGQRRLDDPADFVRLELEAALARKIRVIPVLVQDTPMPRAEELPPSLAPLARRNAIELSDVRWSYDVDRLAGTIQGVLRERIPAPPPERPPAPLPEIASAVARAWPRAAVFLLAAVLLVSAGWISKNRFPSAADATVAVPTVEKPAPFEAPPAAPATTLEEPTELQEPEPAGKEPEPAGKEPEPAGKGAPPINAASSPPPPSSYRRPVPAEISPPINEVRKAPPEETFRLPEVEIDAPKDGARAGKCVRASGVITGLVTGQRAFLGMRNREGMTYSRGELFPAADGRWSFKAASSHHDFEIFVLIATSREAGEALNEASIRDEGLPRLPRETFLTGPIVSVKTSKLEWSLKQGCGKG